MSLLAMVLLRLCSMSNAKGDKTSDLSQLTGWLTGWLTEWLRTASLEISDNRYQPVDMSCRKPSAEPD